MAARRRGRSGATDNYHGLVQHKRRDRWKPWRSVAFRFIACCNAPCCNSETPCPAPLEASATTRRRWPWIWPCRAAGRTAPSPGACSTGCSRRPGFRFDGISGTSAGAMNAAVMAASHAAGGAPAARAALAAFWRKVSEGARLSPFRRGPTRRAARPLDLGFLARLHRHGLRLAAVLALRPQPGRARTRCARFWPTASTSASWRERRSSCSSPPPTSIPAAVVCSAMRRSRPT